MAKLHMDSLTKQPHRKALRLALNNLPPELDETYNEALTRISSQDKEDTKIAHQVLGWIIHATRPLTMKQLQHALSVEPEQTELDEETLIDEELLISTCLGLITVDHTSKEVRLVHYTAQKYFEHRLLELIPDNHLRIASTCLTYLSFKTCQEIDEFTSDKEIKALIDRYPFLDYAGSVWGVHARRDDQKLVQQILHFLSPAATYLSSRLMIAGSKSLTHESTHKHWNYPIKYEARVSGHNMAAYFGLQHTLMTLLSKASDTKDMINSTLLVCTARGNQSLVQLLLDRDANINSCSWLGYTPLQLAIMNDNLYMTKVLLDRDADVNKRYSPTTPLQLAAQNGYVAIVQALLEHGAKVNLIHHDAAHTSEYTALRLAVLIEDLESINVLLDGGADINALHLNGQWLFSPGETSLYGFRTTVLFDAVSQQQEAIVNLLLDRGADVNMGAATPLYRAVSDRNDRMVSLLIKNGADLRTPGRLEILERLFEKPLKYSPYIKASSAEFQNENFLGQALVAVANTQVEPESVADTLITSGADINFISIDALLQDVLSSGGKYEPGNQGFTPWALNDSLISAKPCLDFPLLAAAKNGNESLVQLLLDRGAKTWEVKKELWLQLAIHAKSKEMHPVERSYPIADRIIDVTREIYRNILTTRDLRILVILGQYQPTGDWRKLFNLGIVPDDVFKEQLQNKVLSEFEMNEFDY